jgi:type IV pilus assembly protein PilW
MTIKFQQAVHHHSRRTQSGVSLIELMIALVIAGLIALGLVQIFGASTATSQMTDGLSRVQENGRFATQFLQRQLRMVGFMGCGADTGRSVQGSFVNHLALFNGTVPGGNKFRFQRPIEAFTAGVGAAPAELAGEPIINGTDVLILRVLSDESTPVLTISKASKTLSLVLGEPAAPFLPAAGENVLFGLQNCRSADVFAGALNGTAPGSALVVGGDTSPNVYLDPSVDNCGAAPCPWDFRISNAFLNAKPLVGAASLNAEVHRAEYYALFVKNNPAGLPSLFMMRFNRNNTNLNGAEEFVEGVENMQLRFGYDTSGTTDAAIDEYKTAAQVIAGAADDAAKDANWRRVLSVRVGLLIRSPGRAGAKDRTYKVIDVNVTPAANDGAIREVYDTTIALRNRLFNS